MTHIFDSDIAKKYGVLEAVLIQNIWYWIEHNKANDINFHDGRYWTYNSMAAFSELFPYASVKQIRHALDHLRDEGIILTGNYNKKPYDRTLWYTLSDYGLTICPVGQMDMPLRANGFAPEGTPIPYINTDINTYKDICQIDVKTVVDLYNDICRSLPRCTKISDTRRRHIKARLKDFSIEEIETAFRRVEASDFLSGRSGTWKASFDWLIKSEDNMRKVLEGNYTNHTKPKSQHEALAQAYRELEEEEYARNHHG